VLLVDDNPVNLQIFYQTLNGAGYRLLVSKNGKEAVRIARQARPQLILLDIQMPPENTRQSVI
jgi:CheY-like chemotaxis protein